MDDLWVVAGTAALTLLDKPTNELFARLENHFPGELQYVGYHYGKPYSAVAFASAFYLTGALFKDRWAKDTGLELGVTLLTSGLLQTVLKDVVGRARPGPGIGPYEFRPLEGSLAYHAFPSGHSAVAFGISIVMARRVRASLSKFFSIHLQQLLPCREWTQTHIGFPTSLWWCPCLGMQQDRSYPIAFKWNNGESLRKSQLEFYTWSPRIDLDWKILERGPSMPLVCMLLSSHKRVAGR